MAPRAFPIVLAMAGVALCSPASAGSSAFGARSQPTPQRSAPARNLGERDALGPSRGAAAPEGHRSTFGRRLFGWRPGRSVSANGEAKQGESRSGATPTLHEERPAIAAGQLARWGTTANDLAAGKVVKYQDNPARGQMRSHIVSIRLSGGRVVRAIFKPAAGEMAWGGIERGTMYFREIAASSLSDELKLDLVPPTVAMTVKGEVGSTQLFVEGASDARTTDTTAIRADRIEALHVFDYVLEHDDRQRGKNWMVGLRAGERVPVAIDHGLGFPHHDKTWPDDRLVRNERPPPQIKDSATRERILHSSSERVAHVLSKSGLEPNAIRRTVLRLEILRAANGGPAAASDERIHAWVTAAKPPPRP